VSGVLLPLRRAAGATAELSDEALVAACVTFERAALGALFDRYHARVHRFLWRLVGTRPHDVDDLVQATFLEVWRCAADYRGRSPVRTWVLGISANLARHHVRSGLRRTAAFEVLRGSPAAPVDPTEAAGHRELVGRLGHALEALPEPLRVAFVMCDLEEIPGVEAAQALGVRPGTMWRRLHEARKALRTALEERR
jgi:RNA polymerase sigma-70 factor (ECF subfamily)